MAKKSKKKTSKKRSTAGSKTDQHKVVASPVRREIWSFLRSQGPHTVSEIARGLGRSQTSLYAHIKMLDRSGVIKPTGSKRSGKRHATIYSSGVAENKLAYDPKNKLSVKAAARYATALLRRANREMTEHLAEGAAGLKGKNRDTTLLGSRTRLTKKQLSEINAHIDAIEKIVAKSDSSDSSEIYSVNIAVYPVEDNFYYED
ncbi:MAG TPA: ArsR family transcriptional regulator [Phycisphaerales bacterium]|nr:ArsR family transcriptional regulator [Phycisphaerales bacterium]